jgi:adenine phosphoribosyltransferase
MLLKRAAALLRPVPDFPKPGILFWDIAPVLRDHEAYSHLIDRFVEYWKSQQIDVVAGFDARGFIFGSLLAYKMGLPFEQIRKKGKLPGFTIEEKYDLEYGKNAVLEMLDDGFIAGKRVLLIDDLLATGGTVFAGAKLVERLGGTVVGLACVTEIPFLGGRGKLADYPVQSLISIIGDKPEWDVEYCVDMLLNAPSNNIVLVKRQSEPLGFAMSGGRIEARESVLSAVIREVQEELGCAVEIFRVLPGSLAARGRDPRGHKVSIVVEGYTEESTFRGEAGKTEPFACDVNELPPESEFAFDHGSFLYDHLKSLA